MMLLTFTLGTVAAVVGISTTLSGAIVGVLFRAAAAAWRDERDAAVEKAERLADRVHELELIVAKLEERPTVEEFAKANSLEHKEIIGALTAMQQEIHGNTVAVEFLVKQTFPTSGPAES